jgi:hypothetical protein
LGGVSCSVLQLCSWSLLSNARTDIWGLPRICIYRKVGTLQKPHPFSLYFSINFISFCLRLL